MSYETVSGFFDESENAKIALQMLRSSGFSAKTRLVAGPKRRQIVLPLSNLSSTKFTIAFACVGAIVGSALGVYASVTFGLDSIFGSHPILAGLVGLVLGIMFGTLAGLLLDLEPNRPTASVNNARGNYLLVKVQTENSIERSRVLAIFAESKATETFVLSGPTHSDYESRMNRSNKTGAS